MLIARKITKYIGETPILRDISFEIKKGDFVGFLGPNGAGKTSTMRILAQTLSRSGGDLKMFSFDPDKDASLIRSKIGYLPEKPALYPQLSVYEQISLIASLKCRDKSQLRDMTEDLINKCRLSEVRTKLCGILSKGFRQKVGLALAIAGSPELLILDEPTSGLDPREVVEIRSLIKSIGENTTIIFSSHLLSEVSNLCKRAIIFVKGRTVLDISISEVDNLEKVFLEALESNSI